MVVRIFFAIFFFAAVAICGSTEAQLLNGNWSVATGMMHGKTVPANALASMSLNINGTSFEAKSGGMVSSGTLGANTLASPAQLEFTISTGADQGRKLKAVYEIQNGELKIAFSETEEYPTSFDSSDQNKYLVLSYKSSGASTLADSAAAPTMSPRAEAAARRPRRNMSPRAQGK